MIEKEISAKMEECVESFEKVLKAVRTGRASTGMIEDTKVEVYGTFMRLKDVALLSISDFDQIMITPFDKTAIKDIQRSLESQDLSMIFAPEDRGIRAKIPPITSEYRERMVKRIAKDLENAKIQIRRTRMQFNDKIKEDKKNRTITEDNSKILSKVVQEMTDKYVKVLEKCFDGKKSEILSG
ncbi:MAG: ribosome recycling factor [Chlamydiia bacterium]|nr:ribosome recycling factor [Chlamydiia bacterium]